MGLAEALDGSFLTAKRGQKYKSPILIIANTDRLAEKQLKLFNLFYFMEVVKSDADNGMTISSSERSAAANKVKLHRNYMYPYPWPNFNLRAASLGRRM